MAGTLLGRSVGFTVGRGVGYSVSDKPGYGGGELLAQVGTFTSPVSTEGNQVVSLDSGIWSGASPKVVLLWGCGLGADSVNTQSAMAFGVGISSTSRAAVSAFSQDAQGTSVADRRHSNALCITTLTPNGVVGEEADYVSSAANAFTINWTTSDAARIYNYLALGGDDLEVDLIEIQSKASTGTQAYSHSLSGLPTAAIAFGVSTATAPPATTTTAVMSFGVSDMTTDISSQTVSVDAQTTSATERNQTANLIAAPDGAGGTLDVGVVSAVSASDITINWTTADASQRYSWILLLSGVSAKVITDTQKTSTGVKTTAVGFTPKCALLTSVMGVSSASVVAGANLAIGALDASGNQVMAGLSDEDAQTTTDADRIQDSNEVLKSIDYAQSVTAAATGSFSGTDLSLNWTTADATAREFGGLVLG